MVQGVTFATVAEKEIIDAVFENRGLIKVSINLRLPEGRHKIENAMIRNQEISNFIFHSYEGGHTIKSIRASSRSGNLLDENGTGRILRRQAAAAARAAEEALKKAEDANKSVVTEQKLPKKQLAPSKPINRNAPKAQLPVTSENPPKQPFAAPTKIVKESHAPISVAGKVLSAASSKAPPVVTGNVKRLLDAAKAQSAINSTLKSVPPAKTIVIKGMPEQSAQSPEPKQTVRKTATKTKPEAITAEPAVKPKLKKTMPKKKIPLEQAEPELELDTELLPKKVGTSFVFVRL
ncbi:unnamed protein product [Gongylonema pulchrum]|uniref:Uncharacterized protein n=1 Tax=Gongylonema pulchrum TaxID=637853 RepID=A0A3P7RM72_9BILA|nr:unnamed protein product [Gongylonema pulchrum]